MAKQKIEIEVEVPPGMEVNECHWIWSDTVNFVNHEYDVKHRLTFREKYVPPSWLKPGTWLYQNGADWWVSEFEPNQFGSRGFSAPLPKNLFPDFVPPPTNPYQISEAK